MDDEEWRAMLCVEAAVVATPVTLAPGARWEGVQRIAVERHAG
jgi:D-hexose-6-phosphate mutarotase